MAVLVTGGTGFIGSRVTSALLAKGHRVVAVDNAPDTERYRRLVDRFGSQQLRLQTADVTDVAALEGAIAGEDLTAIVHLAYILGTASKKEVQRSTLVNLVGSAHVFAVARAHHVERVVCASSLAVFGSDLEYAVDDLPLRDDAAQLVCRGLRLYGAGKVYLEAMAETYRETGGPLAVGLRPSIVYGGAPANGSIDWIYSAVASAAAGQPVTIANGNASVCLIHVDDLADQFVALVTLPADRFRSTYFYNSGGDTCTIADFGAALRRAFPSVPIDVEPGEQQNVMGLAAAFSGESIDALMGGRRRYTPIEAGIRKYASDILDGRIHD